MIDKFAIVHKWRKIYWSQFYDQVKFVEDIL